MSGINRNQNVANINVNGIDGFADVAVMSRHESSPTLRHLPGKERVLPVSKCQVRRVLETRCQSSKQGMPLCYRNAGYRRTGSTLSAATTAAPMSGFMAARAADAGRWPGQIPASTWGAFVIQSAIRG